MSLNGCQWLVVTWRGENEAVTFGNMNVLNSAFIHCVYYQHVIYCGNPPGMAQSRSVPS